MKLRAGTQGNFNNIVLANYSIGLDFETDRTHNWFKSGMKLNNIRFENITTIWKSKTNVDMSAVFTTNTTATGAGNGVLLPDWAKNWTGLSFFNPTEAGN
jgi:hypothetical protein